MKYLRPWARLKIPLYNLNDKRTIFKLITIFYLFLFLGYWPVHSNLELNRLKDKQNQNFIFTICINKSCNNKSLSKSQSSNFKSLNAKKELTFKDFIREQNKEVKKIDNLINFYRNNHQKIVEDYKKSLESFSKENQNNYFKELMDSSLTIENLELYKEDLIAYKHLKTQANIHEYIKMRV